MQNAIDFIDKTKQQVRKTVESVDEVKRSLNKQKSERETIEKVQNRR